MDVAWFTLVVKPRQAKRNQILHLHNLGSFIATGISNVIRDPPLAWWPAFVIKGFISRTG